MKSIGLLLCFLLQFSSCASLKQSTVINYTDQNNNHFTISRSEIVYKAMKPVESSSGIYSGGTDKRVQITSSEFKHLELLAIEMIEDQKSHAQRREMLTAVLWINTAGENKKAILSPSSLRSQFESALRNTVRLDR